MDFPSPAAHWADFYRRAGFRAFPVWPGEKRPMYAGWQADASTDPALLNRYFADPARNLGLVTGEKFDAWDIEVEHVPAFSDWLTTNGYVIPESPIASTGRGGLHILTEPTNVNHTRKLYLAGTHIGELKSTGGFILACPSETTGPYRWTWLPTNLRLQPAPTWLLDLVREPQKAIQSRPLRSVSLRPQLDIQPLVVAVRDARQNDRNATLHWAACRAYDDGIAQKIALDQLLPPFMAIALPGESAYEREIEGRGTIASAYNRG